MVGPRDRLISGVLDRNGRALVRMQCGPGTVESRKKLAFGMQVAPPLIITGLIDTGCTGLSVSSRVIQRLDLSFIDECTTKTAGGVVLTRFFSASVAFLNDTSNVVFDLPEIRISDLPPLFTNFEALIGWDVLQHCSMHYVGPDRRFTLSF
jgi:hypothetical protein